MDTIKNSHPPIIVTVAIVKAVFWLYKILRWFFLVLFCIHFSHSGNAQSNCSNPIHTIVCPDTMFKNQTNLNQINDAPFLCNIPGEDLVYHVIAPNGALMLYVSVFNATQPYAVMVQTAACGNGACATKYGVKGDTHFKFPVANATDYYVWIDAATTFTFDISFGADTSITTITIPGSQGNFSFDSSLCALPLFKSTMPFFQVQYNGAYKIMPLTLSPLYQQGTLCVSIFLKNNLGDEGAKVFEFNFATGLTNIATASSFPGFYNAGNWISQQVGNNITFTFDDAANTGRGDFTGAPDSCLEYKFCFQLTPITNLPSATEIQVLVTGDKWGAPATYTYQYGCCPVKNTLCSGQGTNGSSGPGSAATSFGFAFNDPGSLPVEFVDFSLSTTQKTVTVQWTTALEVNCDNYTVERSVNAKAWSEVYKTKALGTSGTTNTYLWIDEHPQLGSSFYRIKETALDGHVTYSHTRKINILEHPSYTYIVTNGNLSVHSPDHLLSKIELSNIDAKNIIEQNCSNKSECIISIEHLVSGIYILSITNVDAERINYKIAIL